MLPTKPEDILTAALAVGAAVVLAALAEPEVELGDSEAVEEAEVSEGAELEVDSADDEAGEDDSEPVADVVVVRVVRVPLLTGPPGMMEEEETV